VAFSGLGLNQNITCGKMFIDAQMIIYFQAAYQQVFLIHKSSVEKKNKLQISDKK
jgi:hypothetical protein